MFVRANVKGLETEAVITVIHELAHRYDYKFLKNDAKLTTLYRSIKSSDRAEKRDFRESAHEAAPMPKPGDRMAFGKQGLFEVTHLSSPRGTFLVHLRRVDPLGVAKGGPASATHRVTLDKWMKIKAADVGLKKKQVFVTKYAETSPRENFAEMLAFYCTGRLSPQQTELLGQAVGRKLTLIKPVDLAKLAAKAGHKPALGTLPPDPRRARFEPIVAAAGPPPPEEARMLVQALGADGAQQYAFTQAESDPGDHWVAVLAEILKLKR